MKQKYVLYSSYCFLLLHLLFVGQKNRWEEDYWPPTPEHVKKKQEQILVIQKYQSFNKSVISGVPEFILMCIEVGKQLNMIYLLQEMIVYNII